MNMRNDDTMPAPEGPLEMPGPEGRRLWLALREAAAAERDPSGPGEANEADEAGLLAAYLDGRLAGAELEAYEAHLATSPAALELFLAADTALGATQAVPDALLRRAAALVPGEALAPAGRRGGGFWARLLGGGGDLEIGGGGAVAIGRGSRLRPLTLVATLAAVLVISAVGFELGRFGYAVAAETYFAEGDGFSVASQAGF